MYVSSSAFLGFVLVALLAVLIFMPSDGEVPPVATPQPVALSSDVILAQAAAEQMKVLSKMAKDGNDADLAAVHPTATPVPTLTPVPTPRPSEGERIVKQVVSPVLFCGTIVGVIFLGTLVILAWESSRRRQDDALRRQQELDKMRLEREMLQARNEAEARRVSN